MLCEHDCCCRATTAEEGVLRVHRGERERARWELQDPDVEQQVLALAGVIQERGLEREENVEGRRPVAEEPLRAREMQRSTENRLLATGQVIRKCGAQAGHRRRCHVDLDIRQRHVKVRARHCIWTPGYAGDRYGAGDRCELGNKEQLLHTGGRRSALPLVDSAESREVSWRVCEIIGNHKRLYVEAGALPLRVAA